MLSKISNREVHLIVMNCNCLLRIKGKKFSSTYQEFWLWIVCKLMGSWCM